MKSDEREVWVIRWIDAYQEQEADPEAKSWHPIETIGWLIDEDALYVKLATSLNHGGTVDVFAIPVGTILGRTRFKASKSKGDRNG